MEQESLLTGIEFNPVIASVGKRFLNYLIDLIVFYVIMFVLGILLVRQIYEWRLESGEAAATLKLQLVAIFILLLYYFLCEAFSGGRTIGKFVTGTKVVNEDGTDITMNTALLRTLCRLVPFEPLSTFGGRPWHDKWTRTYVIDVKQTALQNPTLQA
jgi:uncharacterized RDD family membrane protein YckC